MSLKTIKNSQQNWKIKAIERNKIIHDKNKVIKVLKKRNEVLKEKYEKLLASATSFGEPPSVISPHHQVAKGHQYSVHLVLFCVQFLSYGAQSLRGCVHSLLCINLCFRLGFNKLPSYTTIRNWACKLGYYRVTYHHKSAEPWFILIDESISIGCEKILLVLGTPLSRLSFDKALNLSQMRVLSMEISKSWKSEDIDLVLQKVSENYPIGYIVSDCGNNLMKTYLLGNYLHIPDCTHYLANILSSLYEKDTVFIDFCKQCGALRKRWSLSKYASVMPPSQRNKVRFANLFPLIEWAINTLEKWETLEEEVQTSLSFLTENKSWLLEFYSIQCKNLAIQKLLKIEGYHEKTQQEILNILHENKQKDYEKEAVFIERTIVYLAVLADKKPGGIGKIYCSSDIIESAFGKLKQKINPNSCREMTVFVLTLASIGSDYSIEEVKKGLETIKEKDLKNYRKRSRK